MPHPNVVLCTTIKQFRSFSACLCRAQHALFHRTVIDACIGTARNINKISIIFNDFVEVLGSLRSIMLTSNKTSYPGRTTATPTHKCLACCCLSHKVAVSFLDANALFGLCVRACRQTERRQNATATERAAVKCCTCVLHTLISIATISGWLIASSHGCQRFDTFHACV